MAVRLNVLVLRPAGGGSSWHEQCDDLLGHLLGRAGLDVTLLERLPRPDDGSTETLALESIGGHVACLAWREPEQLLADLEQAGRAMIRRAHAGDPACESDAAARSDSPSTPNSGRAYCFDMRQHRDPHRVIEDLQSLLQNLQVSTFQIAGLGPAQPSAARTPPPARATGEPNPPVSKPAASTASRPATRSANDRSQSEALDQLVDQLDELDI